MRFFHSVISTCTITLSCVIVQHDTANALDCAPVNSGSKETVIASASTWSNFRKSPGSIAFEAKRLLAEAEGGLSAASPSEKKTDCPLQNPPAIVMEVVPNKLLKEYDEKPICDKLSVETQKTPLRYSNTFATLDEVNEWFGEFSAGKGKNGNDLYERCPGDCSPSYKNQITKAGNQFQVNTSVHCGTARDKDDNQYKLSYSYEWN